ncbi:MAG TPA: glycogen debranching N-terminal domain-containing protein, partial [Caulobacteraceae bacterium]|nr:glycogen debranching N-terminal domain-containing protein [Caulobacteraceae bacterium]
MALEITVGPPRLAINQGYGVLITDPDGQIPWPTDKGFYHSDTRVISSWQLFANGEQWDLLNSGNTAHHAARIFLTNKAIHTEAGPIAAGTLGLAIGRSIGGGLHEDLDLVNHGMARVRFNLEIAVRSDFADLFEVKSGNIVRRGRIATDWSQRRGQLKTTYRNKDFQRTVTTAVRRCGSKPVYANGRISFEIDLEPGGVWHACLLYEIGDGAGEGDAPEHCIASSGEAPSQHRLGHWRDTVLKIETSNEQFYSFYRQSLDDMAALRLPIEGTDHLQFVPAAGVPWFVALFGRDSLIISLQNAMVHPEFAAGALEVLNRYQAAARDDYRDAEPGKIMHELRRGELAHFKLIPHTPYYGTADATILYLIVLHSAWRCTGDASLLERFLPAAEQCLAWIDAYGDRDGDGFQEYQTRSTAGYANQGWKDAGEALVYPDGSLVKGPKALVELQGYVYDAWLRMAQVFDALGKPARATALRQKAKVLFERFNDAFWDEASGFYAFCLDGEKKQVLSVASNPGQCLWSGIVPADRAERVVKRLMAPDMWSGWGIRTLSADHPAYNPYAYQTGAVWPHDNALIALGFRRYGFADEAARVARDISRAASYFALHQMPELYSGLQRDPSNFPVQYLGANVPQGWAAGACFAMLQALVGFQPDAPSGKLYLDPALPVWMTELTLQDLRVGSQSFDLRFRRDGAATRFEVLKGDASAV